VAHFYFLWISKLGHFSAELAPTHKRGADPLYRYHQWQANLRVLEVSEIKTVPYVPLSHPFVERLIGSIRREFLDQMLFWTATDLEDKLVRFQHYYNEHQTHTGLNGRTPEPPAAGPRADVNLSLFTWQRHCRGLYQTPAVA
jgi:putative transposase